MTITRKDVQKAYERLIAALSEAGAETGSAYLGINSPGDGRTRYEVANIPGMGTRVFLGSRDAWTALHFAADAIYAASLKRRTDGPSPVYGLN